MWDGTSYLCEVRVRGLPSSEVHLRFQETLLLQLFDDAIRDTEHGHPTRNATINGGLKHRLLNLELCATIVDSPPALSSYSTVLHDMMCLTSSVRPTTELSTYVVITHHNIHPPRLLYQVT